MENVQPTHEMAKGPDADVPRAGPLCLATSRTGISEVDARNPVVWPGRVLWPPALSCPSRCLIRGFELFPPFVRLPSPLPPFVVAFWPLPAVSFFPSVSCRYSCPRPSFPSRIPSFLPLFFPASSLFLRPSLSCNQLLASNFLHFEAHSSFTANFLHFEGHFSLTTPFLHFEVHFSLTATFFAF